MFYSLFALRYKIIDHVSFEIVLKTQFQVAWADLTLCSQELSQISDEPDTTSLELRWKEGMYMIILSFKFSMALSKYNTGVVIIHVMYVVRLPRIQ